MSDVMKITTEIINMFDNSPNIEDYSINGAHRWFFVTKDNEVFSGVINPEKDILINLMMIGKQTNHRVFDTGDEYLQIIRIMKLNGYHEGACTTIDGEHTSAHMIELISDDNTIVIGYTDDCVFCTGESINDLPDIINPDDINDDDIIHYDENDNETIIFNRILDICSHILTKRLHNFIANLDDPENLLKHLRSSSEGYSIECEFDASIYSEEPGMVTLEYHKDCQSYSKAVNFKDFYSEFKKFTNVIFDNYVILEDETKKNYDDCNSFSFGDGFIIMGFSTISEIFEYYEIEVDGNLPHDEY